METQYDKKYKSNSNKFIPIVLYLDNGGLLHSLVVPKVRVYREDSYISQNTILSDECFRHRYIGYITNQLNTWIHNWLKKYNLTEEEASLNVTPRHNLKITPIIYIAGGNGNHKNYCEERVKEGEFIEGCLFYKNLEYDPSYKAKCSKKQLDELIEQTKDLINKLKDKKFIENYQVNNNSLSDDNFFQTLSRVTLSIFKMATISGNYYNGEYSKINAKGFIYAHWNTVIRELNIYKTIMLYKNENPKLISLFKELESIIISFAKKHHLRY